MARTAAQVEADLSAVRLRMAQIISGHSATTANGVSITNHSIDALRRREKDLIKELNAVSASAGTNSGPLVVVDSSG